jgi:carbonic anhydrase
MISAVDALKRLREGNRRFASGTTSDSESGFLANRAEFAAGQTPFAIILACSDSRVPVEMVFDQGLGDLFVIRVAGNIVAPSQVGSVEFAAAQLGAKLVVVLGHSNCGAVEATLRELAQEQELRSPNLRAIVDRIRPAIESLTDQNVSLQDAVIANVHQSVSRLQHGSLILETLVASGGLVIVGAEYSIESGEVEILDTRELA